MFRPITSNLRLTSIKMNQFVVNTSMYFSTPNESRRTYNCKLSWKVIKIGKGH